MKDADRFILTIRPEPAGLDHLGRDPAYRLKCLLKRMLRDHGLRCVRIDQAPQTPASGELVDKTPNGATSAAKGRQTAQTAQSAQPKKGPGTQRKEDRWRHRK